MPGSRQRVCKAFAHEAPDRTPLFEIFWGFHPIYWDICGRNIATDEAMNWDALAEGVSWEELVEERAQATFKICKFFGLDVVHAPGTPSRDYTRPMKTGKKSWTLKGIDYVFNERTKLVELLNPGEIFADSKKASEQAAIEDIENWDGEIKPSSEESFTVLRRVQQLSEKEGLDWLYMGECGAGTAAAFYPPFMLMWIVCEPELFQRWLDKVKCQAFQMTKELIAHGCEIIAMGGDVSCDKGPFISPAHYHQFLFPIIKEHVDLIHAHGALAVYTSDGNHWAIKDDFFFNSGTDGYKEVDKAAGMTFPRLIEEKVAEKVCIIGNMDARHTLCHGSVEEVRREVIECLQYGQQTPGGHILHASHSVHEDVKVKNYYALIKAYREYFGMEPL